MGSFLSYFIKIFIFHLMVYDTLPPLIDIAVPVTSKNQTCYSDVIHTSHVSYMAHFV